MVPLHEQLKKSHRFAVNSQVCRYFSFFSDFQNFTKNEMFSKKVTKDLCDVKFLNEIFNFSAVSKILSNLHRCQMIPKILSNKV